MNRNFFAISIISLIILSAAAYSDSFQERLQKYPTTLSAAQDDVKENVLYLQHPPTKLKGRTNRKIDQAYIAENLIVFDMKSEDFEPFAGLSSRLDDYTIYLSGEIHGVSANTDLVLYLTKYLYETQGVRYLMLERGYGLSQLLNQYIQTGDESILDKAYELSPSVMSWYNKEGYSFIKDLYEFNTSLPENEKLTLLGYDIAYELNTSAYYLRTLIPDEAAPEDIKTNIDLIRNAASDQHGFMPILDVYNEMYLKEDSYRWFFGDDFFNFKFTVQNIVQSYVCGKEPNRYIDNFHLLRENAIVKNFTELMEHYDIQKGYAHGGNFHADYSNSHYNEWVVDYTLGSYLWFDYPGTRNKVYNIEILYDNCRTDGIKGSFGSNIMVKKADYGIDTDSVFIDYTGDGSPMKSIYDYGFMAYIIVYDSPECTPYRALPYEVDN